MKLIKKLTALLLLACMVLTLACCGEKKAEDTSVESSVAESEDTATETASESVDSESVDSESVDSETESAPEEDAEDAKVPEGTVLADLYAAGMASLEETYGESSVVMFEETSEEMIESYYEGLTAVPTKQFLLAMAPVTGWATEVCMVEVENAEDVETVKNIFEARIEIGASDDGYPETAACWQKYPQVTSCGNFVCMAVLPDGYDLPSEFLFD